MKNTELNIKGKKMKQTYFGKTVIKCGCKSTKVTLINGEEMHRKYPETFGLPSKSFRMFAPVGMLVKVFANSERFWVKIAEDNPCGTAF